MKKKAVAVVLLLLVVFGCIESFANQSISICSFNIQFLGHYKNRDNAALASILEDYDIVVVQELVAPPYPLSYPDGTAAKADIEAQAFFEEMICRGFAYWLSEEDTGPGEEIHKNTTATEWWVTFYKPGSVEPATDLAWGFLDDDRSENADYERVPYAFPFRTTDAEGDFVLISVHLDAHGAGRRAEEVDAIAEWIDAHDGTEKDFIILGDMNFQNCAELAAVLPSGFVSLNNTCAATNTATNGKPYDHVLYQLASSPEVQSDLEIVDLAVVMEPYWSSSSDYPGDPYDHNAFRMLYSDHRPIVFWLEHDGPDDD